MHYLFVLVIVIAKTHLVIYFKTFDIIAFAQENTKIFLLSTNIPESNITVLTQLLFLSEEIQQNFLFMLFMLQVGVVLQYSLNVIYTQKLHLPKYYNATVSER